MSRCTFEQLIKQALKQMITHRLDTLHSRLLSAPYTHVAHLDLGLGIWQGEVWSKWCIHLLSHTAPLDKSRVMTHLWKELMFARVSVNTHIIFLILSLLQHLHIHPLSECLVLAPVSLRLPSWKPCLLWLVSSHRPLFSPMRIYHLAHTPKKFCSF